MIAARPLLAIRCSAQSTAGRFSTERDQIFKVGDRGEGKNARPWISNRMEAEASEGSVSKDMEADETRRKAVRGGSKIRFMLPESGRDFRPESGARVRGRINRLLLGAGIRPRIEAGIRPRFEAGFRRLKIDFSLSRFRRPARAGAQIIEYWRSRSDPVLGRRRRRAGSRDDVHGAPLVVVESEVAPCANCLHPLERQA